MSADVESIVHDKVVLATNDFGFRLLSELGNQDAEKNVIISSLSIATALAMTYNGAEGDTKEAMAKTLAIDGLSQQEVNSAHAALRSAAEHMDPKIQLALANSIWVRDGITISSDFVHRISEYFAGKTSNLDFGNPGAADTINAWVAEQTREKIQEIVTPELVRIAILILINAIYFKGTWTRQFDKERTADGTFTLLDGSRKKHPLMHQSGNYDYYENKTFQAVSIPYGNRRMSMYIFLPKPRVSIGKFQKSLTVENWQNWMSEFEGMEGSIALPRFKVEYDTRLATILMNLGMGTAFSNDANFQGMGAGALKISEVIHKTFVEVNEEGTEAAAVTAVVMLRSSRPTNAFKMTVDRPFFMAIRDNDTSAIYFMGFVLNPA